MAKVRNKKKRGGSFFSPVISITLVLFLTGLFALLIIYAGRLKDFLKENVQVSIIFREETKDADIFRLKKMCQNDKNIVKTEYISKDQAKVIMIKELGEDASEILGFNPFPSSLDVFFTSDYAQVDSIEKFKTKMKRFSFIKEISYQRVILENIDKNVRLGAMIILSFMVVFLLIAIVLINNTIRLTLYSKRFLIKSMQLVGATQAFIRKPFLMKAINFGILGGIIADVLLVVLILVLNKYIPYNVIGDYRINIILGILLIGFGIVITGISSYFSIKRYLRTKLDDLY